MPIQCFLPSVLGTEGWEGLLTKLLTIIHNDFSPYIYTETLETFKYKKPSGPKVRPSSLTGSLLINDKMINLRGCEIIKDDRKKAKTLGAFSVFFLPFAMQQPEAWHRK